LVLCIIFSTGLWAQSAAAHPVGKAEKVVIGERVTLHSDILNEERHLLIRLPEGYAASGHRYPVLFLLDAEYFFQQVAAAVQFLSECEYIRDHPIPQFIVVGIVNVDRDRDYTPTHYPKHGPLRFPTSGRAESFLEFIEAELIPFIDSHYRTHPYRVLSGWSFGGLFTVHTLFTSPDLFSAYLAVSPSLWWDNQLLVKKADQIFKSGKTINKPLVVTLGSLEGGDMGASVRMGFVPLLRRQSISDLFFEYVVIVGEGHDQVPFKGLSDGLKVLSRMGAFRTELWTADSRQKVSPQHLGK
jgi:predicted alpha/beta superfamily hydrolase